MVLNEKNSDIVIIGAGPAGLMAGYETHSFEKGINVTLLTKNHIIGHPAHCSGLISYNGLQTLGINMNDLQTRISVNEINRAKFISPSNDIFEINRGPNSMLSLDRPSLDRYLASKVQKSGCKVNIKNRVVQIQYKDNFWRLTSKSEDGNIIYKCKILINTEGIHAHLANSINLPVPSKIWGFPAFQSIFTNIRDLESDCCELYFGKKFAPGFFGWVIPIDEDSARIGIAVSSWISGNTREFFHKFISKHSRLKSRLRLAKVTQSYGGFVPVAGPVSKTYFKSYMVAGDAAGQTKATTGGGVSLGGFCGRLAGKYARKIIEGELTTDQGVKEYENQWKAHLQPDILFMKYLRRAMTFFSDKTWNNLIDIAATTNIGKSLRNTDIDLHGTRLMKYALGPSVLRRGFTLAPKMITNLFQGLLV